MDDKKLAFIDACKAFYEIAHSPSAYEYLLDKLQIIDHSYHMHFTGEYGETYTVSVILHGTQIFVCANHSDTKKPNVHVSTMEDTDGYTYKSREYYECVVNMYNYFVTQQKTIEDYYKGRMNNE